MRKQTHPTINRLDSEDDRNTSDTIDSTNENILKLDPIEFGKVSEVDDDGEKKYCQQILEESLATINNAKLTAADNINAAEKNVIANDGVNTNINKQNINKNSQNHKPPNGYSNGNTVISRDDALILLPEGGKNDGSTKSHKGSDLHTDADVTVSVANTKKK